MGRSIAALLLAGCALSLCGRASAQVALVSQGPQDHAVLEQLTGMLDEPISERAQGDLHGLGAIMDAARGSWPSRYVVVIDRNADSVYALRPSDRTSVARVLSAELLADSPYAVALAIAELLEWLGATPRGAPQKEAGVAHPQPQSQSQPSDDGERTPPAAEPERSPRPLFGFAASAGLELGASPSADLRLARLALGLEGQLGRGSRPLWLALAARFAAPASLERKLDLALRSEAADALEYHSSELALQLALGLGHGASALAFGPFVGLSPVTVTLYDARGQKAGTGDHDAWTGLLGVGVRLRYPLALGFAFDLGAEAELLLAPVRYRVTGRSVLEDGPLRAQTRLGIVWESAFAR